MHFILDCDDVLLDWQRGFRKWLAATHNLCPDPHGPASWSLSDWLGVPGPDCLALISEFNASPSFGQLEAFPEARAAIPLLKANGHQLTVLTSCSEEPATILRRKENLGRVFGGAIDRLLCLPLGESKAHWLNVLRTGIWIEDNYRNAVMGLNAGNKTFMMRRRHNRDDEIQSDRRITWIDDWRPVISLFA